MQSDALPVRQPVDPGLSSEFHRWPLPGYLWPALEKHSQSIFCTEPHLRIHGTLTSDIEAWVWRHHGCIAGLWLFRRQGRTARVLNEVASETVSAVMQFADALFARYRELDVIELHALHLLAASPPPSSKRGWNDTAADHQATSPPCDGEPCEQDRGGAAGDTEGEGADSRKPARHPWQRAAVSEDFVLELPSTIDDWHASLSSRTREKLRQCLRRAQRSEPSLRFRLFHDADISERQVRAVLQMSRARMRAKGRSYGMDAREERRLWTLMRERGLLATIEVDGRMRAGLLCTLAGNDVYMHVIAHDPAFDELRLGYLCCVLCIEAAIAQRRHRFHFLWGWYDYKVRLGGQRRVLEHALLWRSRVAACRHPILFLRQQWLGLRALLREQRQARQIRTARQAGDPSRVH
ncbi:MAG: hypothetical protein RL404_935 [Pseudomonadota bacterium]